MYKFLKVTQKWVEICDSIMFDYHKLFLIRMYN